MKNIIWNCLEALFLYYLITDVHGFYDMHEVKCHLFVQIEREEGHGILCNYLTIIQSLWTLFHTTSFRNQCGEVKGIDCTEIEESKNSWLFGSLLLDTMSHCQLLRKCLLFSDFLAPKPLSAFAFPCVNTFAFLWMWWWLFWVMDLSLCLHLCSC